MTFFTKTLLTLLASCLWATVASAQNAAVVVELFTSQGCYSCPPAEKLIYEKYAKAPDIIALEFHVDYWDTLIYGLAGSWKDPYSSKRHTERQTFYNQKIRRTSSVYTPQVVVHGVYQSVGSKESDIDENIAKARDNMANVDAKITINPDGQNQLDAKVDGAVLDSDFLYYAIYLREVVTEVPSGENKGETLKSRNIVTQFDWVKATKRSISIPSFNPKTHDCVAWLQRGIAGRILTAQRCST